MVSARFAVAIVTVTTVDTFVESRMEFLSNLIRPWKRRRTEGPTDGGNTVTENGVSDNGNPTPLSETNFHEIDERQRDDELNQRVQAAETISQMARKKYESTKLRNKNLETAAKLGSVVLLETEDDLKNKVNMLKENLNEMRRRDILNAEHNLLTTMINKHGASIHRTSTKTSRSDIETRADIQNQAIEKIKNSICNLWDWLLKRKMKHRFNNWSPSPMILKIQRL